MEFNCNTTFLLHSDCCLFHLPFESTTHLTFYTTRCGHFDQKCFFVLATFGQKIEIDPVAQLKIVKHH